MIHFRTDNTEGYSAAELAELNEAWQKIASHGGYAFEDSDDIAAQSLLDNWSETLLAAYDAGKRGSDLTAWFYE